MQDSDSDGSLDADAVCDRWLAEAREDSLRRMERRLAERARQTEARQERQRAVQRWQTCMGMTAEEGYVADDDDERRAPQPNADDERHAPRANVKRVTFLGSADGPAADAIDTSAVDTSADEAKVAKTAD